MRIRSKPIWRHESRQGQQTNSVPEIAFPGWRAYCWFGLVNDLDHRIITENDFRQVAEQDSYYVDRRWDYFCEVTKILNEINLGKVLELGPRRLPMVRDADIMDTRDWGLPLTWHHDACCVPWPVPGDSYDLFVALQVWEHLREAQVEAFAEVRRIASRAVLSFPYQWNCPKDRIHHGITREMIAEWTHHLVPARVIVVGSERRRLICYFDSLN